MLKKKMRTVLHIDYTSTEFDYMSSVASVAKGECIYQEEVGVEPNLKLYNWNKLAGKVAKSCSRRE